MQQSALSTAYVQVAVQAIENGLPVDPSADVVEMAFVVVGAIPTTGDWHTGSWALGAGGAWLAQVLVGPTGGVVLGRGPYAVWVRITRGAEMPVLQAGGTLQVV
jgi:hypothetical protein